MNQKYLGIVLIIAGILVASLTYVAKVREDKAIGIIIDAQSGSCYLADGTCLHEDRDWTLYIIGWVVSAALIALGIYLVAVDKTHEHMMRHHHEVATALASAKKEDSKKEAFTAFMSAFSEEEQSVLKAIHEQEGIKQATLRYRTGTSKTGLSLMLKSLEERGIISRKQAGKTNQVYLRKKF